MDELTPFLQNHFDKISYSYNLKTSEDPNFETCSRTALTSFKIEFWRSMKIRTRELIKRKILKHFEAKQDRKKTVRTPLLEIEKIEMSEYELNLVFKYQYGKHIMPDLWKDVGGHPWAKNDKP